MLRFLFVAFTILAINVAFSFIIKWMFKDKYIHYPGTYLELINIQIEHLFQAAKDYRTKFGIIGLFGLTAYLFCISDAMSTEFYVFNFIVGVSVLIQAVYLALILNRELPGSINNS